MIFSAATIRTSAIFSTAINPTSGFLSAIPEWGIASAVMIPYLRSATKENINNSKEDKNPESDGVLNEVISGKMADINLSAGIDTALKTVAVARDYFASGFGDIEEYRNAVIAATASLTPPPCEEKINELASLLYSKGSVTEIDIQRILGINYGALLILSSLNVSIRTYERELHKRGGKTVADEMEFQAKLLMSQQARVREMFTENEVLSGEITEKVRLLGLRDAACRVLGRRKRHVCLAAKDDGTERIKDSDVIRAIESTLGTKLNTPSLNKVSGTLILEADESECISYEVSTLSRPSRVGVPSGDSSCFFERDGVLFVVLSDGMGTGEIAMQTSRLVCDYLREGAEGAEDIEILISAINGIVLASGTECCASVDVFYLDLYTGEGGFVKAGAVPSFLKKGDSVRRIRAKSAPIGAMENVDLQTCLTEVCAGDIIIMMSDGVCEIPEETFWLLDTVNSASKINAEELAKKIIAEAERNNRTGDDMSVTVVEVKRAPLRKEGV